MNPADESLLSDAARERAALICLDTLERVEVDWNPERFRVTRSSRLRGQDRPMNALSSPTAIVGGEESFETELLLDATRPVGGELRDLLVVAETLASWMEPLAESGLPPRLLFQWGGFRFRGYLAELDRVWERFDVDGRPLRGRLWLRLLR